MKLLRLSTAIVLAAAVAVPGAALAQAEDHEQHHPGAEAGASAEGAPAAASSPGGAMAPAATLEGQQATEPPASQPGMTESGAASEGMMGSGMMGRGMMEPEMMRRMHERMMSSHGPVIVVIPVHGGGMMNRDGMPGGGMMAMMGGMGLGMHGTAGSPDAMPAVRDLTMGVVTPARHLSAEDVRHFLEHRLEAHGNPRLALGEVAETDEDTISAEIVTIDGSLVETLSVDRHSGEIRPVR